MGICFLRCKVWQEFFNNDTCFLGYAYILWWRNSVVINSHQITKIQTITALYFLCLFDKDYVPQHRSSNILHYNTVYISSNIIHTVGATFPQYISCFWGSISLFNISTREAYLSCHKVTSIRIIFEVYGFVEYTSTKIHCFMKVIHDSFPSHNRCCNSP